MADQSYIIFDGAASTLPWPADLHGKPILVFKHSRTGAWDSFLRSLESSAEVSGVIITAPATSLSIMFSGIKAGLSAEFPKIMTKTIVLLTDADEEEQLEALKKLHGFRSLRLSSWSEKHLIDFIGTIFKAPLDAVPQLPKLVASEIGATKLVDYYDLLGLQREASADEVAASLQYYREYWQERSRNAESGSTAAYSLALINQSEAVLLDEGNRQRYDAMLGTVRTQPAAGPTATTPARKKDGNSYEAPQWAKDGHRTAMQPIKRESRSLVDAPPWRSSLAGKAPDDAEIFATAYEDEELSRIATSTRAFRPDVEWPPLIWPPDNWVPRVNPLIEELSELEIQSFPDDKKSEERYNSTGEPDDSTPFDSHGATLPTSRQLVVERVPMPAGRLEIWFATALSRDVRGAFRDEVGAMYGTQIATSDKLRFVVAGTSKIEEYGSGSPTDEILGFFGKSKLADIRDAARAIAKQVEVVPAGLLGLAIDPDARVGRFFRFGNLNNQVAATPLFRVPNLDAVEIAKPRGFEALLGRYRFTALAMAGIVLLGLYSWVVYLSVGGASESGSPTLETLAATSYIRGDGVVLKWQGNWEKVAVYRVDTGESTAHWKLLKTLTHRKSEAIDPEPINHPGRYRYLLVGTILQPSRTGISEIQALDVR